MTGFDGNSAVLTTRATLHHQIFSESPNDNPRVMREAEPALEGMSLTPIRVTEEEVVLSTAVAARVRPTTTHRWQEASGVLLDAIHRIYSAGGHRPRRSHAPMPDHFLEDSEMEREMHRL